ncbi:MAG: tRNA (N6-isopentenyl adenosine(37)-C2)-methylthiotransferase MiaB [Bacteroidota bacterium]|nr:tRNA (N6-isopentenyl adenosine(37)-C2)-methylthiotransferase MiaB [Bacteroidota bacterium]
MDLNDINTEENSGKKEQKFYIETYGCQMNVADSEVVISILQDEGYEKTNEINEADIILINTCSIRENAEQRVWGRLDVFKNIKKKKPSLRVGVIGCMAERLKEDIINKKKIVDIVVGPDAYKDLPTLLDTAKNGQKVVNVLLSQDETYGDISPVRLDKNGVSAFVSIMRGCNNMCTYCIVPFVRGRERSRDPESIIREIKEIVEQGYKEITLLGQNVNSYNWESDEEHKHKHIHKHRHNISFAQLLEKVAKLNPNLRIRFTTSHPKDISNDLLYTMAMYNNICNHIHLPAQSGSTNVLKLMNRNYTREEYMDRIMAIKEILPECAISTDMMTGFCNETEEDHKDTLSLMEWVNYDYAYMFKYSERPYTKAARIFDDNVPEEVKSRRLTEIIDLQNSLSKINKKQDIGKIYEVLVEGPSKKSEMSLVGRNSQNKVIVFPREDYKIGDYVNVKINETTSATLIGTAVKKK